MRRNRHRRMRVLALANRIVRRHYMSFASLGVLSIALAATLGANSSSHPGPGGAAAHPQNEARIEQQLAASTRAQVTYLLPHTTYFLYDDPRQRIQLESTLRDEANYLDAAGMYTMRDGYVFLEVTAATWESISILIDEVAPIAPLVGYEIAVLDLRSK